MAENSNLTRELEGFFISLGFDVNTDGVKEMAAQATNTVTVLRRLVTWVTGPTAAALGLFVAHSAAAAEEMSDFAIANEASVETMQELGFAATNSGSSMDALKSSVSNLNIAIGEVALGVGRNVTTFRKLGISVRGSEGELKSFDNILEEVADRMQGISLQESTALANKIGIDPSLVPMLRGGAEGIKELREEARLLGIQSEEDIKAGADVAGAIRKTVFLMGALKQEIAAGLFPAAKQLINQFRAWILANRELLRQNIGAAIKVFTLLLSRAWDWTSKFVGAVIDLVKWLSQFRIVVFAATAAMVAFLAIGAARAFGVLVIAVMSAVRALMAFNAAALMIPLAVGLAILAVGLLIDDFLVWKDGGDSLLEEVFGKFPDAVKQIEKFFDPLAKVIQFFTDAYAAARNFGSYVKDTLLGTINDLVSRFSKFIGMEQLNPFTPSIGDSSKSIFQGGGMLGNSTTTTNAPVSNTTNVGDITVNVNSSDPNTAGRNVVDELAKRGLVMTRNAQSSVER